MKRRCLDRSELRAAALQRGVVLLYALVTLVIMMIGAVALVRSFEGSLFTAGNIAFKRDLQNQSERAVDRAFTAFRSGGSLSTIAARAANLSSSNYSATMLAVNAQGIPNALQNDGTFAAVGVAANDIAVASQGVTVRYVIDRMCASAGDERTLGAAGCVLADNPVPPGTSSANLQGPERVSGGSNPPVLQQSVVYRLSVKVTGPRNTQSFFQSTFTVPST